MIKEQSRSKGRAEGAAAKGTGPKREQISSKSLLISRFSLLNKVNTFNLTVYILEYDHIVN